jgi:hypothetical protein
MPAPPAPIAATAPRIPAAPAPASAPRRQVVLVSNGPGELTTWVRPTLRAWRALDPSARVALALVPCQFASGGEAALARTFGADAVTTPTAYLRAAAFGRAPAELTEPGSSGPGVVLSLGGSVGAAVAIARRLGFAAMRYSFVPYSARGLRRLFVHDERTARKARRLGAPPGRVEVIGNLVADALEQADPVAPAGEPHVLLLPGSRDAFAVHLIPFMLALADALQARYPHAAFVWPVSRLLSAEAIAAGIAGRQRATLGGVAGRRDGDVVVTLAGTRIRMADEPERPAQLQSATIAITIPGTNTLELGIAGVPSVVMLPLNRPEIIPLEGPGHWLSLLPLVGVPLKRAAVRLFVQRLRYPVSLPNQLTGEPLMVELQGALDVATVASAAADLIDDPADRARRAARLRASMPRPGAAERLVRRVYEDLGWQLPEAPPSTAPLAAGRGP